jgi:hypothetical protein
MTNEALDEKYLFYVADTLNVSVSRAGLMIDECIKSTCATLNLQYSDVYSFIFSEENLVYTMSNLVRLDRPKKRPDLRKRLEHEYKEQSIIVLEKIRGQNIKRRPDLIKKLAQQGISLPKNIPIKDIKDCNKMTIDECLHSNTCFVLDDKCYSRKIADAEIINQDPDKYVKEKLGKTEDLKHMVKIAAYLYHNFDGGGLSDNSYDALEWHLKKREKIKGRDFEKIGALPIEKLQIRLPYPMPSLEKVKPGTLDLVKFLDIFNAKQSTQRCLWSLKLDGVSGMLIYKNSILHMMYTRGDGTIGGDVSYLKDYITIGLPKKINVKYFVVRGEFIISKKNWDEKYKENYSNARAFVSGKINSGYVTAALHDIEFIAHEIMVTSQGNVIDKTVPQPSQALKLLESLGFKVVDYDVFPNLPTTF